MNFTKEKNKKLFLRVWAVLGITALMSLVFGHGCSKVGTDTTFMQACEAGQKVVAYQNTITSALLYGGNIREKMRSCLGVDKLSDVTARVFEERKTNFSEYGYASEVSGPMIMGVVALAGEICNDLFAQEKSAKEGSNENYAGENLGRIRFFSDAYDFSGTSRTTSQQDVSDSIRLLSEECWSAGDMVPEAAIGPNAIGSGGDANEILTNFFANPGDLSSDAQVGAFTDYQIALTACTSALASLSSIAQ